MTPTVIPLVLILHHAILPRADQWRRPRYAPCPRVPNMNASAFVLSLIVPRWVKRIAPLAAQKFLGRFPAVMSKRLRRLPPKTGVATPAPRLLAGRRAQLAVSTAHHHLKFDVMQSSILDMLNDFEPLWELSQSHNG
jgi:hypothetical protein